MPTLAVYVVGEMSAADASKPSMIRMLGKLNQPRIPSHLGLTFMWHGLNRPGTDIYRFGINGIDHITVLQLKDLLLNIRSAGGKLWTVSVKDQDAGNMVISAEFESLLATG